MNASKILSAIAVALIAASGAAHAESYEGVQAVNSVRSRSEVNTEAVAAVQAGQRSIDPKSRVAPMLTASRDRAPVRDQAVAAAHAPNLDREAFVNSVVPAQFNDASTGNRQAAL